MRAQARYRRFKFDRKGYAAFATSDDALEPAMSVARRIATDIAADPDVPRETGDYARSFRAEAGEGTLSFGLGWLHSYAVVRSDDPAAAPLEFGNENTSALHILRDAGARYHHPIQGAR